jgi:hypothetical protein
MFFDSPRRATFGLAVTVLASLAIYTGLLYAVGFPKRWVIIFLSPAAIGLTFAALYGHQEWLAQRFPTEPQARASSAAAPRELLRLALWVAVMGVAYAAAGYFLCRGRNLTALVVAFGGLAAGIRRRTIGVQGGRPY